MSGILWIIIVGFVAGIIARLLSPGPNNPSGFILTTVLGIAGAFLATFIGQAIGHYGPDQGAGFITATIGALLVLFIWNRLVARGVVSIQARGDREIVMAARSRPKYGVATACLCPAIRVFLAAER
jgi:uncharacterized membrane protein YeaQ/YmgE (transglycosylase-associated protein family)